MVIKCICGSDEYKYYEGFLGYEAYICKKCYAVHDHAGIHKPEEWSKRYIKGDQNEIPSNRIWKCIF